MSRILEIKYTVDGFNGESALKVDIPGYENGGTHDMAITQGRYIESEYKLVTLFIDRSQLNDLIFILGQAKKEYGLPD